MPLLEVRCEAIALALLACRADSRVRAKAAGHDRRRAELKAVGSPVVSPDGTQVLYTVRQWEVREGPHGIAHADLEGAGRPAVPARQLTFGERGDSQPQWSPDGRYISFRLGARRGTGDDAPQAQIYLMRAMAAKRGS